MHSACPTAADVASLSTSDAPSVANTFDVGQKFDAEFGNFAPASGTDGLRGLPHYPSALGQAAP